MEAAAAGSVPAAQQGCTEQEVTQRSSGSFVIALVWDCSKSLPICSLPSPGSQDVCESVSVGTEHSATGPRLQRAGCWLCREPTLS